MSPSYGGDNINFSHSTFQGRVTGKEENHHYPAHQVDWPVCVGAIPSRQPTSSNVPSPTNSTKR